MLIPLLTLLILLRLFVVNVRQINTASLGRGLDMRDMPVGEVKTQDVRPISSEVKPEERREGGDCREKVVYEEKLAGRESR